MTDKEKLDKLVTEIERLYHQSLVDENRQAELGLSSAACTSYGKSKVCKELLSFIDSMQKEPKECMYSNNNYTDEDRKVLCGGCEEECKFNKKEEPVSEDLNTAAKEYANNITDKLGYKLQLRRAVCFGANWKEQHLMANAVDVEVKVDAGGYPYIPHIELYDYDKDIPLVKEGDKYKVILIKEG